MFRWIIALVVVAALAGAAGWFAHTRLAPAPTAPTTEAFGGWRMDCGVAGASGCAISQRVISQDAQAQLLQLVVVESDNGPTLTIAAPLGVYIPAGVAVRVGEAEETLPLSFARCLAGGCIADGPVPEAFLDRMRAGEQGSVLIVNRNREAVAIPFALTGFGDALDALHERGSTLDLWGGLTRRPAAEAKEG